MTILCKLTIPPQWFGFRSFNCFHCIGPKVDSVDKSQCPWSCCFVPSETAVYFKNHPFGFLRLHLGANERAMLAHHWIQTDSLTGKFYLHTADLLQQIYEGFQYVLLLPNKLKLIPTLSEIYYQIFSICGGFHTNNLFSTNIEGKGMKGVGSGPYAIQSNCNHFFGIATHISN